MLLWIASRVERDPVVTKLLFAGFAAKCVGVFFRYVSVFFIYDRVGDAVRYNDFATLYYQSWRAGVITWPQYDGKAGTQALELITTAVYVFTGPSPLAGFYVFGSMAFWGTYLIFRAFRTAVPDGRYRRYAALLFLLPSMLYWPSSIGKESWQLLFVGVVAYGVGRFFTGRWTGLIWIALGAAGVGLIRPHIALLLIAALVTAQLLRRTSKTPAAFLAKIVGVAVMLGALVFFIQSSADFLGLDEVTADSVTEKVEWAGGQTAQGGSAFTPVPLTSPIGIPMAFLTVLFRPFPWEASSGLVLLQSLEGIVLIGLLIKAWPQLRQLPKLLGVTPYLTFALAYVCAYVLAFSGFGNFGIIARQRSLMLPFFLVLLALPLVIDARRRSRSRRDTEQETSNA
ncbi:MAG: hypothetical protein Q4F67_06575 [Propionibacteriaceae bacterium]|nr:hypothetical protein [Propionibacteriaceae bacterium]